MPIFPRFAAHFRSPLGYFLGLSGDFFHDIFEGKHERGFAVLGTAPDVPQDHAGAPRTPQEPPESPKNRCQNPGCP